MCYKLCLSEANNKMEIGYKRVIRGLFHGEYGSSIKQNQLNCVADLANHERISGMNITC